MPQDNPLGDYSRWYPNRRRQTGPPVNRNQAQGQHVRSPRRRTDPRYAPRNPDDLYEAYRPSLGFHQKVTPEFVQDTRKEREESYWWNGVGWDGGLPLGTTVGADPRSDPAARRRAIEARQQQQRSQSDKMALAGPGSSYGEDPAPAHVPAGTSQRALEAAGTPEALQYPTTPAPLSAMDIAELDARRRAAERNLRNAQAKRDFGVAEADRMLQRALRSIDVQSEKDERGARTSQAARGMAFAPMGLGRELVELRDAKARSTLAAQEDKAVKVAALEEMVRQSQEERADELASVAQVEALLGSDLDELFRGVGA